MKKIIDRICGLFCYCYTHHKREGWDGYFTYVCPECAETPQYKAALENYFLTNP